MSADERSGSATEVDLAVRRRVGDLARLHQLDEGQAGRLEVLLRVIASDERAPTTVRDPAAAIDQHIADALVALSLPVVRDALVAADLGAGAGLPGLALAAALPACRWSLVESVSRKVAFMDRAIARMGLENAFPVNLRAEEWRQGRAANDLVTARAVAPASVVLEYAAPLLRLGGSFVDWRTRMDEADMRSARASALILGLERAAAHAVEPFDGAHSRFLYVYVKVRDTPDRFPRRPGIARKRPLLAST